jgi:Tfp pilus assembly protein PilE
MKMRKRRKAILARIKYRKAFGWYVQRVERAIVEASLKMSKALHEVYTREKHEREKEKT